MRWVTRDSGASSYFSVAHRRVLFFPQRLELHDRQPSRGPGPEAVPCLHTISWFIYICLAAVDTALFEMAYSPSAWFQTCE